MAQELSVEFPWGKWLRAFHCPVCGKPIAGSDVTKGESPCAHLDWVYADNYAQFLYTSPSVQQILDQIAAAEEAAELEAEEAEAAGNVPTVRPDDTPLLRKLQAAWCEPFKIQIAFTTPGVGCRPVPSTVRYGVNFLVD